MKQQLGCSKSASAIGYEVEGLTTNAVSLISRKQDDFAAEGLVSCAREGALTRQSRSSDCSRTSQGFRKDSIMRNRGSHLLRLAAASVLVVANLALPSTAAARRGDCEICGWCPDGGPGQWVECCLPQVCPMPFAATDDCHDDDDVCHQHGTPCYCPGGDNQ